jgi:hypothetical protein
LEDRFKLGVQRESREGQLGVQLESGKARVAFIGANL